MSSIASLPLTLELKPATAWLAALFVWLLTVAVSIAQSALIWPIRLTVIVILLGAGIFVMLRELPALNPHALRQAILNPDNTWTLIDRQGVRMDAVLLPSVRSIPAVALFRWKTAEAHLRHMRWVLVTHHTCGESAFRRLRIRLRFSQRASRG